VFDLFSPSGVPLSLTFYNPDFMMREETERLRQEQDATEERRRELQRQLSHLDKALTYQDCIQEFAHRLSQGLDRMDFTQRRELLRLLVDEVVYDDHQVTIKTIIPLGSAGPADEVQLYPVPQGGQGDGRRSFPATC